jgi:hypothetical protein
MINLNVWVKAKKKQLEKAAFLEGLTGSSP